MTELRHRSTNFIAESTDLVNDLASHCSPSARYFLGAMPSMTASSSFEADIIDLSVVVVGVSLVVQ